jgi:hypothetical protein
MDLAGLIGREQNCNQVKISSDCLVVQYQYKYAKQCEQRKIHEQTARRLNQKTGWHRDKKEDTIGARSDSALVMSRAISRS